MTVTRINQFKAAAGKEKDLLSFLHSLVPYISSSEGCLSCEVLQSKDNLDDFVVLEKWLSEESHQKSVENYPKENMQAAMALFAAPPKGGFFQS
ncbi:hypothetical protein BGP75_07115 [Motiliproteus sp. MSK22-1]|nr:hypothetical protein BGP75_07115 [Motiliproteus sp. MSK22-1]